MIYEPAVKEDERGYFFESFNEKAFNEEGIRLHWVQDNQSSSVKGVIRGLHYQLPPFAQTKLVRVLRGRILDIAVDIRKGSPGFGKVFSIELSAKNHKQVLIPPGFAHGFSVLSKRAVVFYKCDNFYNKESEAGIRYDDPTLGIDWMLDKKEVIVSDKDKKFPALSDCRNAFVFES